jgi:Protein of unknown function (DUF1279)
MAKIRIRIQQSGCVVDETLYKTISTTRSLFIGRLGDEDDQSKRNTRLYQTSLPFVCGYRFLSTDNISNHNKDSPPNLQSSTTDSMRERATSMRETARGHYRDFREHPAKSARLGAKSFGGMLRQYGPVFLGTYMSVYFATLGGLFLGVESGVLDPAGLFHMLGHADDDTSGETINTVKLVIDFMEQYEFTSKFVHIVEKRPEVANLAVAWIAVKFTEPLRLATSLAITPRIARYFGIQPKGLPPYTPEDEAVNDETTTKEKESSPR